ncbi:MAG: type II toxin-antitoxin system RelE/ParE family toxin [Verrucomicrobia bacterium]|nr:type II toxin-antitoxin system RelE/ParE family toxin [Verrucomicrobiota bacterium]
MKYTLVVRPEVDADLLEAETWYDRQQAGLGREFLQSVREAMARLPRNPLLYRVRHRRRQIRWTYPRRFPYRIIFRVIQDTIVVYAVLPAARHDRQWKSRVLAKDGHAGEVPEIGVDVVVHPRLWIGERRKRKPCPPVVAPSKRAPASEFFSILPFYTTPIFLRLSG